MKKQLLIAAAFLWLGAANAQEIIFEQDFEGNPEELADEGWYIAVADGEASLYGVFDPMPALQNIGFQGSALGMTTFFVGNQGPQHVPDADIVIMTPVITLPEGPVSLSYRAGSLGTPVGESHYSVYVIIEEDMEGIESEADISIMLNGKTPVQTGSASNNSSVINNSIADYAGQPVMIAFRLYDTQDNIAFFIDDIAVTLGALGTNDLVTTQFSAYPNPATDLITVSAAQNSVIANVSVTDLNGRTVINKRFTGTNTAQLDLSGLSSGVYMMSVSSDKNTSTKKIVKQ